MKQNFLAEKQQLQQELSQYLTDIEVQKKEITEEVDTYRDTLSNSYKKSIKVLSHSKTGVLILGGLYVVYLLSSWVWGKKTPPKQAYREEVIITAPKKESSVAKQIKSSIASFLLSIAKEELKRLLKQWRNK